jgi:transposase
MKALSVLDPLATFVDVGSERMHVSIAGGTPQVFGTVTSQLHGLRDWLRSNKVKSVAMEATGVYWMPLYSVLEEAGFTVSMVNGRQLKNVPGRKSDMMDCQWGSTLHAYGLLRAGFVPSAEIRRIQDYMRLRGDHITLAASHVQHMQKALERMNIKLHDQIASLTGVSGLAVVRAILAGERDPERLLALCDRQIQRNKAERVKESLRGTWATEHLFALKQALMSWEHYQRQIDECDRMIAGLLPTPNDDDPKGRGPRRSSPGVNAPDIDDLHRILRHMCDGRDLTQLPAHTEYSVLQLVSETGTDLTKWRTEKHFSSWTGLAPGSAQSGKRRGKVKCRRNRVGRLFCVMARSLAQSKDIALGGFYRRLAARRGGLVANIALARKLAELFWRVMVHGIEYVEQGLARYDEQVLKTKQQALQRLARQLGRQLVPLPEENLWEAPAI